MKDPIRAALESDPHFREAEESFGSAMRNGETAEEYLARRKRQAPPLLIEVHRNLRLLHEECTRACAQEGDPRKHARLSYILFAIAELSFRSTRAIEADLAPKDQELAALELEHWFKKFRGHLSERTGQFHIKWGTKH